MVKKNQWHEVVQNAYIINIFIYISEWFVSDPEENAISTENICASCLNIIDEEEFISALGQEWHLECFRYEKYDKNSWVYPFLTIINSSILNSCVFTGVYIFHNASNENIGLHFSSLTHLKTHSSGMSKFNIYFLVGN